MIACSSLRAKGIRCENIHKIVSDLSEIFMSPRVIKEHILGKERRLKGPVCKALANEIGLDGALCHRRRRVVRRRGCGSLVLEPSFRTLVARQAL